MAITQTRRVTASRQVTAKTKNVVLEWLGLEVTRKSDKGWDLYFLVEIGHPTDAKKKVAITFPEMPLDLSKRNDNEYKFGHRESGGREGSMVCSIPMPTSEAVSVQVFAIQAKDKTRSSGRILKKISDFADAEVATKLGPAAAKNPYVAGGIIVNKAVGVIGKLLSKTQDKSRGFAALDEHFNDADLKAGQTPPRRVAFTGGDLALVYRWRILD